MAADASKFVLPASPNWYCSNVADCSLNKIYAFGARNCVYLLDVSLETPVFEGQLVGHTERVTSVCFSKHKLHANFVASGSDDKTVKIWDAETKRALLEHKAHGAKVTCLTWSPLVTDLVVSGDEKGQIIAWRYAEGNVFGGCPVQEHIFTVALSYLTEGELAVGYKSGLILVLDESRDGGLSIVHKLQGHSSEIHSLAWCPTPKQQIDFGLLHDKTTAAEGHLIVSGSRDQTVRLWDTAHGKVLSIKQLPKRSAQKWKDKHDPHWAKDRLWLSVCWPAASPGHLITSSQGGELLLWDLSKEGKEQYQTFGLGHSRIVFNVSCDVAGTRIMTVSMDRQIIIWDPQHLRSLHTLPTLGGFAYSLSISPLDPGTLGVGVGDNMLRVWQTASSVGPYEALTLWQGIKSKVMVVEWHPSKEGLLAFGADDGQVGVYSIISKRAEISATYHKRTVYSLSWGPPCPQTDVDSSTTHNLYSCAGDGSVLQHRTGHFMDDPVDVNSLILKTNNLKHKPFNRTDVSWNPDGTVMALGNEDGSIEVYVPPDLMQIGMIITHKKSITTLVWHHGYNDISTGDGISCKYWLASGSNESTVHVHDLSSMLGESSSPRPRSAPITECFRQLSGHSGRVTGLSWSPHQSELLLSSSYDGTAQVWDVVKGQPLCNFRGHSSRVMCVVWSYLDPDLVYSGGEDGTVRPWRPSMQQHQQPPVPDKKVTLSASKSAKNKKSKQKAKGKAVSTEKESWRQGREPKLDGNKDGNVETSEIASDESREKQPCSSTERTDLPSAANALVDDKEESVSSSDKKTEKVVTEEAVEKSEEKSESEGKSACDMKEGVSAELAEENLDSQRESEKKTSGVDFQPELVIPLRSRVTLETVTSSSSSAAKKKKKVKSMFPLSAVADNKSKAVTQEECVELAKMLYGQADDKSSVGTSTSQGAAGSEGLVNLGLFADRRAAYRMLNTEGQHHKENNNLDYRLQLEIWKGNLSGALEMAANSKQLTDWLVAVSPLAGRDVWMATTRAFADQLASQGAHYRAVLYYLACHDTYKAIEMFRKQAMYREAIALAKVRLSPLDPVLFDLYSAWARKLETDNSFEQAAKCYLAVHSSADAVRVLCRRGDQPSLRTALQVALLCGESEQAVSLSLRVTQSYLLTSKWQEAHDILKSCPGVEAHVLNVCFHELLLVTLFKEQIISEDMCEAGTPTEISSFLSSDPKTSEPLGKYLRLEAPCCDSPWIANNKPGKWFIVCVLEAWYHCGVFKPDSKVTLYQTLKNYYESISTGTETIPEILTKMSLEITLGLLSTLTGNIYTACQYWLQALYSCDKNCLFAIQRQLCWLLLPNGMRSLENLLTLSHELSGVSASDGQTKGENVGQLFQHFHAYYCKALVTELWYRCHEVLAIFQCDGDISVKNGVQKDGTDSVISTEVSDSECDLLMDSKPSKNGDTSEISDSNQISNDEKFGKAIQEGEARLTATDEDNQSTSFNSNEPLLTKKIGAVGKHNLMSTLKNFKAALLSDHHTRLGNLRELLTEIRKAMLLKRSRQFLLAGSVGSQLNQKKKKDKKKAQSAQKAQPVGFPASSSEGDPTSETGSVGSSVEQAESGQTENIVDEGVVTEQSESLVEVIDKTVGDEGERKSPGSLSADSNEYPTVHGILEAASESEVTAKDLTMLDGELPVDLRFMENDITLEFLAEEEEKVLKELGQFELKDLPFPSPLESALTMGNLCACPEGLPISAADLREVGASVVLWAQNYAQSSTDLKGIRRLTYLYNKGTFSVVKNMVWQ